MSKAENPPPPVVEMPIVPPPASMTVNHDPRVVLYTYDGKALGRRCGF